MENGVVIVTYNRLELLKECITCVQEQTVPFDKVIIVNNHSNDGTTEYLEQYEDESAYVILNEQENHGGAGGFYEGIKEAQNYNLDWVLIIDDDAMIRKNYLEALIQYSMLHPEVNALSGNVYVDREIHLTHRRRITSELLFMEGDVPQELYEQEAFRCDCATFCGLMIRGNVIKEIGLPMREYFIWYDDSEYSLRLKKYGGIVNVTGTGLDHKTVIPEESEGLLDRTSWRHYYGYRNRYDTAIRHYGRMTAVMVAFQYHVLSIISRGMLISASKREHARFNIQMIHDALRDGKMHKLGFNDRYHW